MNNPQLAAEVADRVLFDPALSAHDVGFSANGAEVLVHGRVASIEEKQALLRAVARVPGVQAVKDALVIRPAPDGAGCGLTLPQLGIFAQGTNAHYFLEFDLLPAVTQAQAVTSFTRLRTPEVSSGGVNLVVAFRGEVWREVAPWDAPESLTDFHEISGEQGRSAPATQHDAWLWISGSAADVTWDHARAAAAVIGDVAQLAADHTGFTYRDSRDITGFVDGTANPPLRRAPDVALVPAGHPGEGGSHVLAMRWVHDLKRFDRLPVQEQERVIGRTKQDSVELPAADMPPTAHIARVQVDVGGHELEIYRRSVPFGGVEEHGLNFVAFSADRSRYERMLARMFGNSGDGQRDRLTDFSRPVAGAYYFAPSLSALSQVSPEPSSTAPRASRSK